MLNKDTLIMTIMLSILEITEILVPQVIPIPIIDRTLGTIMILTIIASRTITEVGITVEIQTIIHIIIMDPNGSLTQEIIMNIITKAIITSQVEKIGSTINIDIEK